MDVDLEALVLEHAAAPAPERARRSSRRPSAAVEEQVLGDGERRDDRGSLVDTSDPLAPALAVGEAGRSCACEADPACIGRQQPGQHTDERGLAGAVAADQRARIADRDRHETSLSAWLAPKRFETPIASATGDAAKAASPVRRLGAMQTVPARPAIARYLTWLAQSVGSSTLAAVTTGAGSRSIRLPLKSSMRLS